MLACGPFCYPGGIFCGLASILDGWAKSHKERSSDHSRPLFLASRAAEGPASDNASEQAQPCLCPGSEPALQLLDPSRPACMRARVAWAADDETYSNEKDSTVGGAGDASRGTPYSNAALGSVPLTTHATAHREQRAMSQSPLGRRAGASPPRGNTSPNRATVVQAAFATASRPSATRGSLPNLHNEAAGSAAGTFASSRAFVVLVPPIQVPQAAPTRSIAPHASTLPAPPKVAEHTRTSQRPARSTSREGGGSNVSSTVTSQQLDVGRALAVHRPPGAPAAPSEQLLHRMHSSPSPAGTGGTARKSVAARSSRGTASTVVPPLQAKVGTLPHKQTGASVHGTRRGASAASAGGRIGAVQMAPWGATTAVVTKPSAAWQAPTSGLPTSLAAGGRTAEGDARLALLETAQAASTMQANADGAWRWAGWDGRVMRRRRGTAQASTGKATAAATTAVPSNVTAAGRARDGRLGLGAVSAGYGASRASGCARTRCRPVPGTVTSTTAGTLETSAHSVPLPPCAHAGAATPSPVGAAGFSTRDRKHRKKPARPRTTGASAAADAATTELVAPHGVLPVTPLALTSSVEEHWRRRLGAGAASPATSPGLLARRSASQPSKQSLPHPARVIPETMTAGRRRPEVAAAGDALSERRRLSASPTRRHRSSDDLSGTTPPTSPLRTSALSPCIHTPALPDIADSAVLATPSSAGALPAILTRRRVSPVLLEPSPTAAPRDTAMSPVPPVLRAPPSHISEAAPAAAASASPAVQPPSPLTSLFATPAPTPPPPDSLRHASIPAPSLFDGSKRSRGSPSPPRRGPGSPNSSLDSAGAGDYVPGQPRPLPAYLTQFWATDADSAPKTSTEHVAGKAALAGLGSRSPRVGVAYVSLHTLPFPFTQREGFARLNP